MREGSCMKPNPFVIHLLGSFSQTDLWPKFNRARLILFWGPFPQCLQAYMRHEVNHTKNVLSVFADSEWRHFISHPLVEGFSASHKMCVDSGFFYFWRNIFVKASSHFPHLFFWHSEFVKYCEAKCLCNASAKAVCVLWYSSLFFLLKARGSTSLLFLRNLLDKLNANQQNILKFIACNEIFLMPATVFMLFRYDGQSFDFFTNDQAIL